jgi:hypothetical protein
VSFFASRVVRDPTGRVVGAYPWPLSRCSADTRARVYETLEVLGFWDLEDGDYYIRGRWNWRFWRHPYARRYPDMVARIRLDRWPLALHRALLRPPWWAA